MKEYCFIRRVNFSFGVVVDRTVQYFRGKQKGKGVLDKISVVIREDVVI